MGCQEKLSFYRVQRLLPTPHLGVLHRGEGDAQHDDAPRPAVRKVQALADLLVRHSKSYICLYFRQRWPAIRRVESSC